MQFRNNLAARSADDVSESSDGDMCIDVEGDDVCCQVPGEVFQETVSYTHLTLPTKA